MTENYDLEKYIGQPVKIKYQDPVYTVITYSDDMLLLLHSTYSYKKENTYVVNTDVWVSYKAVELLQ